VDLIEVVGALEFVVAFDVVDRYHHPYEDHTDRDVEMAFGP
jgi:hypothetical protein